MAEDNGPDKQSLVHAGDRITIPPEDRALFVLDLLKKNAPDLTEWDLVCFSANYLGYISAAHPWLRDLARQICMLVYTAHYADGATDIDTGIRSKVPSNDGHDAKTGDSTEQHQST